LLGYEAPLPGQNFPGSQAQYDSMGAAAVKARELSGGASGPQQINPGGLEAGAHQSNSQQDIYNLLTNLNTMASSMASSLTTTQPQLHHTSLGLHGNEALPDSMQLPSALTPH